ncbi:MAG: bifunctional phosphoribosyl-AMP cyclohydrolase/phosphoribosyl-ATP pyrophosphatase protein [Satyrvirus sp.]|uniref:Bifunctional phosphoribosyl-AMP cyclohydrolase/phosphoribosyl-ATP pyrophosphatase protein n=1 Tax=Satyrvirus sp. TaxID=2487771 RepID=A0A3G5ACL9_9VIRU|nr:MAG: bifunctional phosphoribosyl-AMP cyclohydrolase/phosphoribosyl-ATP pyrophosphatase protein [Satyrvirus sp.]
MSRFSFIPTIDISKGNAVLVKNGKIYKILSPKPVEKAEFISINGDYQIVDIDAAKNDGNNKELIKQIIRLYPGYVGGGIRNLDDAMEYLNFSAKRVIISTGICQQLINSIPKNRLIVAFDIDEEYCVYTNGRTTKHEKKFFEILDEYITSIEMITITFHHTEGTCTGIPVEQVKEIMNYIKDYQIRIIVAGGIKSIDDIEQIFNLGAVPQFGSAFWNGKFTLGDIFECIAKRNNKFMYYDELQLIPTIVQSIDGDVLGLVYSTPESLKLSCDTRIAIFFSRERKKLWTKGSTSGNYHKVHNISFDCECSSVRMIVDGNLFCHLNRKSCFGHFDPSRSNLKNFFKHIVENISKGFEESYTATLLNDGSKLNSKILEETEELICAKGNDEIIHETSDLLYFLIVFLHKYNVDIVDVEKELIRRQYRISKPDFSIPISNNFKIGIMSSNLSNDVSISYLNELFCTEITKSQNSERNYEYFCQNPNIRIIPVKPKDTAIMINNHYIDAVLCYEDIIENYCINAEKIIHRKNISRKVKIVIASKKDVTIEKIKELNKKIVIMAEYVRLTNEWTRKHRIDAKIVHVSGSSESYLVNGLCDLCTVVYDSGKTLEENKLKILDTLVDSSIYLFVHPRSKDMMCNLLDSL